MTRRTEEALNPIYVVALTAAIEGLLLWYVLEEPHEFFATCVITIMALLVGEASHNLGLEMVTRDPVLRRRAMSSFVFTLFLFAVVVAVGAKHAMSGEDAFPLVEFAVVLMATLPTWGFRAYVVAASTGTGRE